MDEERDFVVFTDDDGNEFELEVIEYFSHNDKKYAVLIAPEEDCGCEDEACDCEHEVEMFIMQVVTDEEADTEEFISPADEEMDELIAVVEQLFAEDDCDCDECGDDHGDGCGCGCKA